MARRGIPEINAGSMADIAFLLLIFFLVTTTLETDFGIQRKLPEKVDEEIDMPPINERNIFTVLINSNDQLLVEDEFADISVVREKAKRFINNNGDGSCDYCTGSRSSSSSDNPTKAIVSLQNDRGTSYDMFIAVQNELTAAYNELRNELAERKYGRSYGDLPSDRQKEIRKLFPLNISEAEPVDIGG